jgi:hypothetical protein
MDPKEDVWGVFCERWKHRLQRAGFPPVGVLAEQRPGPVALSLETDAVGEFLKLALGDNALPSTGHLFPQSGAPLADYSASYSVFGRAW